MSDSAQPVAPVNSGDKCPVCGGEPDGYMHCANLLTGEMTAYPMLCPACSATPGVSP